MATTTQRLPMRKYVLTVLVPFEISTDRFSLADRLYLRSQAFSSSLPPLPAGMALQHNAFP